MSNETPATLISLLALCVALLTFLLNAYYRTFRRPRLKVIFGDIFSLSYGRSNELRITADVALANDGAQYAVITKVVGVLSGPDVPSATLQWRSFVESKNVGKEGEEFRPFITFAGWARSLLVPGLGAISQGVSLHSTAACELKAGRYVLTIVVIGGKSAAEYARNSITFVLNESQAQTLKSRAVTDKGVGELLLCVRSASERGWRARYHLGEVRPV